MKIYRIEHNKETFKLIKYEHEMVETVIGVGPYNRGLYSLNHKMLKAHNNESHPCIRNDIKVGEWNYDYHYECVCACPTVDVLNEWFCGFKASLLEENFVVVEYEVNEVVNTISGLQVMFHPDSVVSKKIIQNKLGYIK